MAKKLSWSEVRPNTCMLPQLSEMATNDLEKAGLLLCLLSGPPVQERQGQTGVLLKTTWMG